MEKTVVALFDNLDTAQSAVQQLIDGGFSRDDISVVRTNQQGDYTSGNMVEGRDHDASGAAAGAGIGAVLGGLAGLLVGLGALAIPGIGPIIAAGPLATTLAGAGLGAATGGLVGALADAGIPETDAGAYAEGVRRGGTLVTVRADESQVTPATDILNRFSPVDINQRSGEWRSSGWTGYDTDGGPYSTSSGAPHTHQGAEMRGRTSREDEGYVVDTGLRGENSGGDEDTDSTGDTGSGTVYGGGSSYTGNIDRSNTSDVSKSPGRAGSTASADEDRTLQSGHGAMSTSAGYSSQERRMQEEDSTVHPRSAEGDYQARRDFLGGPETEGDYRAGSSGSSGDYASQGSSVGSSQGHSMEGQQGGHQGDLAGGESITGGLAERTSRRLDELDDDFRGHWNTNYRGSAGFDYGYERYQPAYRHGWQLGEQFQGRDWGDFEASARADWERNHPDDAWQDVRAAVHEGWSRFKSGAGSQGAEQPYKGIEQGGQHAAAAQDPKTFSHEAREVLDQGYDRTVGDMSRGFHTYDQDFRSDWERSHRSSGYGYERYQPAYQYGFNLATDAKYRSRNWSDIESDIRRDWEQRHPNDAWEDFKDAVQHAWNRARSGLRDTRD